MFFKLKGKDRIETLENYAIFLVLSGAVVLSAGIGLSTLSPRGVSAVLAMTGSFIAFISSVFLILVWLYKEMKSA